jgi:acyl dehydratase
MAGTVIPSVPDLKRYVGVSLGSTDWITVDQHQIAAFAEATGDRQWIHVDVERARRESPFGRTIAHGYLTLGLTGALLPELVRVEKSSAVVNSGLEKVRFHTPVPAGSRLRLSARIKDVRQMPSGAARVTVGFQFELEGAQRPACAGDAILVYQP